MFNPYVVADLPIKMGELVLSSPSAPFGAPRPRILSPVDNAFLSGNIGAGIVIILSNITTLMQNLNNFNSNSRVANDNKLNYMKHRESVRVYLAQNPHNTDKWFDFIINRLPAAGRLNLTEESASALLQQFNDADTVKVIGYIEGVFRPNGRATFGRKNPARRTAPESENGGREGSMWPGGSNVVAAKKIEQQDLAQERRESAMGNGAVDPRSTEYEEDLRVQHAWEQSDKMVRHMRDIEAVEKEVGWDSDLDDWDAPQRNQDGRIRWDP